jgi:hypothetical protein
MITQNDLESLIIASRLAGYNVHIDQLRLINWDRGLDSHYPMPLPQGYGAIYIFKWDEIYLKVGKAGCNSNARYQSQHYNPNSSNSNLSRSLINDNQFNGIVNINNVGNWLKENTSRFNILIPDQLNNNFLHFAEAFFILKCTPRYENIRS